MPFLREIISQGAGEEMPGTQHLELYAPRFYMLSPLTHKSISVYATLPKKEVLIASLCFGSLTKAVGVDDTIFLFEDLELLPKLYSNA